MKQFESFKTLKYEFGDVKPDDVLSFEFEYVGDLKNYHYHAEACGSCTSARFDKDEKKLKGTFRIANAGGPYEDDVTKIHKGITVYFDPDEPEFIADPETSRRKRNLKKRSIVLLLKATVIKS